jgi:hypothetical protein
VEIRRNIVEHVSTNHSYLDEGVRILELAHKAVGLYERQEMLEERRVLDSVFSNSTWKEGRLHAVYRKPLYVLAVTNVA